MVLLNKIKGFFQGRKQEVSSVQQANKITAIKSQRIPRKPVEVANNIGDYVKNQVTEFKARGEYLCKLRRERLVSSELLAIDPSL